MGVIGNEGREARDPGLVGLARRKEAAGLGCRRSGRLSVTIFVFLTAHIDCEDRQLWRPILEYRHPLQIEAGVNLCLLHLES